MLTAVLPAAKPGDQILIATVGDGADAMVLQVTPAAAAFSRSIRWAGWSNRRAM